MANSKDRGVADETTRVADGARKGNDRATDTARKVAGAAQEPAQHVVDEWTRGVKEGLTRYQEMFSQLPGFGVNGAEVGEIGRSRPVDRVQYRAAELRSRLAERFVRGFQGGDQRRQHAGSHADPDLACAKGDAGSGRTGEEVVRPLCQSQSRGSPSPCRAARRIRPSRPGRSVSRAPTRARSRRVS